MKRLILVLLAVLGLNLSMAGAWAEVHPPGPDATDPEGYFFDREGVRHRCLHTDEVLGCLYKVTQETDGVQFRFYFVDHEGMKHSYQLAGNSWSPAGPHRYVASASEEGRWEFAFVATATWDRVATYYHADANARPYCGCDGSMGSC